MSNLKHQALAFVLHKGRAANQAKKAKEEQEKLEASLKESTDKLEALSKNNKSSKEETAKAAAQ